MADRQYQPFAELFETPLRNGLTKPKAVRGEGMKMVNMGEVFAHRRIHNLDMDRVPMDSRERDNSLLREGDLLFARQSLVLSGAGKCVLFQGDKEDVTFESHIIRCRIDARKADPAFYFYLFQSSQGRSLIESIVEQVAAAGIRGSDLGRLAVPVPPLPEQKAIAAVLGALDDKIELNRRMNATLEAMARALFQSWFVDFDPVRAKLDGRKPVGLDTATAALFPATFQDSPIGHIPGGWAAVPLYGTAQWVNGAAFKSEDFCAVGVGLPVIKIAELKDGIDSQTKWCQRQAGSNQIIDTGDLLYSWSGSPDTSLEAFLWSGGRGLLNQHIFKVIALTAAQKRFVYYLLQYLRPVLVETARNKQTTGLGHVTIADMKRLLVCVPSKEVLAAFDRSVAAIFDRAFANTLESRTLATLRDTLLPKLLSGELRQSLNQL